MNQDYHHLFKILLIGDIGVGKTSLLARFANNTFSESAVCTVGIEFKIRTIELNGKKCRLQIWDMRPAERFIIITPAFYRYADGIFLVYDVTDRRTFDNIKQWNKEIDKFDNPGSVNKILVGNKSDLVSKKVGIDTDSAKSFADKLGITFFETSAKQSTNVEQAFFTMTTEILNRLSTPKEDHDSRIDIAAVLSSSNQQKSGYCF